MLGDHSPSAWACLFASASWSQDEPSGGATWSTKSLVGSNPLVDCDDDEMELAIDSEDY
jgi:hypothetical protein